MLLISPENMETFAALLRIPFASVRIDDLVGSQRPSQNPAALVKVICLKRLLLAWGYRGIRHPRREGCPKIHARKKRPWRQNQALYGLLACVAYCHREFPGMAPEISRSELYRARIR